MTFQNSNFNGQIRPFSSVFTTLFQVGDGLIIVFAQELAVFISARTLDGPHLALANAWAILIFLTIGNMTSLYASWRTQSLIAIHSKTVMVWSSTVLILIVIAFLTKTSTVFSRVTTSAWFLLTPTLLIVERTILKFILTRMRSAGKNTRSVALVGNDPQADQLRETFEASPWMGMRYIGNFDDRNVDRAAEPSADPHRLGNFDKLIEDAHLGKIDYVYITLPMSAESRIVKLVEALGDTTASVYLVPNFFIFDLMKGKLTEIDGIPLLSLHETPFAGADGWLKRLEDLVLATLIFLLIILPMLVIALAIKLTSPGPVLFKQHRYGLNGKIVEVWKFRSMTCCEDGDTIRQASKSDTRITPLGALLRRTSLDELPQFINVLQGTMSIVGPRPHAVVHNEQYRKLIRGYMLRHKVRPGITGLAQVNGWRGETDTLEKMEMRVKYDLAYMQNWSILLDLKIIFLTLFKGFTNPNAY
jgi:putative colanic acid biosynthesis UDP-glucose lipid carrier transferase